MENIFVVQAFSIYVNANDVGIRPTSCQTLDKSINWYSNLNTNHPRTSHRKIIKKLLVCTASRSQNRPCVWFQHEVSKTLNVIGLFRIFMVADYYSTGYRCNRTCILQVLPVFHKNHSAVQLFGQQVVWKSTSQQKCRNLFTVLQTRLQQRWNHRRINQVFMLIHVDRKFYPRTARLSWFTRVHARGTFAPGKQPCFAGWQHGSEQSTRPFHRSARIIVLDHDVSYGNATFPSDI